MAASSAKPPALDPDFMRRTLFVTAVVVVVLVAWRLIEVLLLLFGAVLIGVLLRTLAEPIQRYARLPPRWAVLAALLGVLAALGLAGWVFGREIQAQVTSLADRLPAAWETLQARLTRLPYGEQMVERLDQLAPAMAGDPAPAPEPEAAATAPADAAPALPGFDASLFSGVRAVAASIMTGLGELVLVVFAGIFLALNPQSYRDGLMRLAPTDRSRKRLGLAFDVSGQGLRRWLLGQLISMSIVAVMVGLGTWAIGLPAPLALGLFAGLLEFVPIVGPTVAALPALLLALMAGPEAAAWTLALYVLVQQVEGNLIMPLVQKRMVALPPVLALFAILSFGALFGAIGILFATPLAVVVFLLVRTLHLGEDLEAAMQSEGG